MTQRRAAAKSASFFGMVVGRDLTALDVAAISTQPRRASPNALVEGLSIHRALDNEPHDQAIVSAAVQRITAKSDIRRA